LSAKNSATELLQFWHVSHLVAIEKLTFFGWGICNKFLQHKVLEISTEKQTLFSSAYFSVSTMTRLAETFVVTYLVNTKTKEKGM
jgi:hypothetical protein